MCLFRVQYGARFLSGQALDAFSSRNGELSTAPPRAGLTFDLPDREVPRPSPQAKIYLLTRPDNLYICTNERGPVHPTAIKPPRASRTCARPSCAPRKNFFRPTDLTPSPCATLRRPPAPIPAA